MFDRVLNKLLNRNIPFFSFGVEIDIQERKILRLIVWGFVKHKQAHNLSEFEKGNFRLHIYLSMLKRY